METPLLSVILPVYNAEPYLERCLDSVIDQTYRNIEIVCVNDGSTDDSRSILDKYASKDSRIIPIHKNNAGSASARRIAAEMANGKYIICIDADDWIEQGMLQEMITCAESYHAEIVSSGVVRDYGSYVAKEQDYFEEGFYAADEYQCTIKSKIVDLENFARFNLSPGLWNKLFLKDLIYPFLIAVPDSIKTDTDTVVSYPSLWSAKNIYIINNAWYHYCQNTSSVMHSLRDDRTKSIKETYDYFEKLKNKYWRDDEAVNNQIEYLKTYSWLQFNPKGILSYKNEKLSGYGKIALNDRVAVYGAGSYGRHLYQYITEETMLHVVAWIDKNGDGEKIIRPDQLCDIEYDVIVIGVLLFDIVDSIVDSLIEMGVPERKILVFSMKNISSIGIK